MATPPKLQANQAVVAPLVTPNQPRHSWTEILDGVHNELQSRNNGLAADLVYIWTTVRNPRLFISWREWKHALHGAIQACQTFRHSNASSHDHSNFPSKLSNFVHVNHDTTHHHYSINSTSVKARSLKINATVDISCHCRVSLQSRRLMIPYRRCRFGVFH